MAKEEAKKKWLNQKEHGISCLFRLIFMVFYIFEIGSCENEEIMLMVR